MTRRDTFYDSDVLLAVYSDEHTANSAATAAREAGAVAVRVGERDDVIASLDSEMQEEMTQSWASPQAFGVVPKEAAKGAALGVPLAVIIGMVVALPLAFIPLPGDVQMSMWAKLLIAAIVGATAGGVVGFIASAGFSAMGPAEPMAAERGVTVRVDDGRPVIEAALRDAAPIRLDRLHGDGTITTVWTEADAEPLVDLRHLDDSVRHPEGQWPPEQAEDEAEERAEHRADQPKGGRTTRR